MENANCLSRIPIKRIYFIHINEIQSQFNVESVLQGMIRMILMKYILGLNELQQISDMGIKCIYLGY